MASNILRKETYTVEPPPEDTPPKPFGGSAAMRPAEIRETVAAGLRGNDNGPATRIRRDIDERLPLPRVVVDWFTGNPIADGKSPPLTIGPVSYLVLNAGIGFAAAAITATTIIYAPAIAPLVVPWTMLIQTGRMRKNQTHLGHEASHRNLFLQGDPRRDQLAPFALGMTLNDFLGELATTTSLSNNMGEYRTDHHLHHDKDSYTTAADPDTVYVRQLENLPRALLNPAAYGRDFAARLRSNLLATRPISVTEPADEPKSEKEVPYWPRRLMGAVWVGFLVSLAFLMPLPAWLLAVFVPYVILFRVSAILQILSLHAWNLPPVTSFQEYADRTWGRFSGIPLPERGLKGLKWLKVWSAWWAEILLLELPFRLGVLSSDLQNHDIHHLEWILKYDLNILPDFVDDWRNQALRRAEVIRDTGDALGMSRREFWGVRAMWRIAEANLKRLRETGQAARRLDGAPDEGIVAFDDHIAIRRKQS